MAILLTGGAGYIGSHTAWNLIEAGHQVVVVDDLSNSSGEAIARIEQELKVKVPILKADLRQTEAVEAFCREHSVESVIHFAGLKAVGESVAKPLHYYQVNLGATFSLLEVCRSLKINRFVFSSSATVYAPETPSPLTEDAPLGPVNPYGQTKAMIEQILADETQARPEFSGVSLRYFNPVGAHVSGLIGESPRGIPNNLVPYIAQVALGQRPFLSVFGSDYPTKDGTGVRDYIHVCDLAEGHRLALEWLAKGQQGLQFINLGTGKGSSVLELLAAYSEVVGRKLEHELVARRPGDVATCFADVDKAQRVLGFSTKQSIEEMLADSWRFNQQNPQGI